MKKQINLSRPHAGKLSLNKKTISNLQPIEMEKMAGGIRTQYRTCYHTGGGGQTKNGNTCYGHNTCNSCVTCYTACATFCGTC